MRAADIRSSTPPVTVTHVITGLQTGGAETLLLRLVAGLDAKGFRCDVISLADRGTIGERLEAMGVRVHTLNAPLGVRTIGALLQLRSILRRVRPRLVQGWMYHGNLAGTLGVWLARLNCPVLWNVRQSFAGFAAEKRLTALFIRLGVAWSRHAARIIYNSQVSAGQHQALGYASDRAVVIRNGFDLDRFKPSVEARTRLRRLLGLGDDVLIVGQVARYHPMKGHAVHLTAISQLPLLERPVHCVLVGRGMEGGNAEINAAITRLGLHGRVHLIGERRDVEDLVAGFDVAVSPSTRNEGMPNVIGEAMACGVPCAVTDVGDASSLVGDTGVVVAPGDPAALASGLQHLLTLTANERQALGARARHRIATGFGLDHMIAEYHQLYEAVLRER